LLIGLASGSTCDGIDAALVEAEGLGLDMRLKHRHSLHQPYPKELRELLFKVSGTASAPARQVGLVHRLMGEAAAAAARQVAEEVGCGTNQIQICGINGHRAWHDAEGRYPSSLELCMAAVVAERTGLTTVSDFGARDLVVGGTGTSLTALIDHLLFHDLREARVLVNLGGLASIVFLPANPRPRQVLGFHAGPCNVLLDALMRRSSSTVQPYDAGGKHAVQGRCLEPLLQRWLADPVIQRRPPRAISPQIYGDDFAAAAVEQARQLSAGLNDLLCTATHFVARCIGQAVTRHLPETPNRVLMSGGGIHNGFLAQLLEHELPGIPLDRIDRYGVPAGARKPVALAGLAALTLDGVPANLTTATGAESSRLLGSLTPGSPANWARCVSWMASMAVPSMAA
jgi:anhydro-N-acetylmuramic acid kinase